ncbi:hypothetical protein KBC03_07255 [Patescibacteria group bacterium]|nr:hypothetical protein [Patescibacteria group bacterium]
MSFEQQDLPVLPSDPTGDDRIVYALKLLAYHNRQVFALLVVRKEAQTNYKIANLYVEDDKKAIVTTAKRMLKREKFTGQVEENVVKSGYALVVKHRNECIAIIVLPEPIDLKTLVPLKCLSFLPVGETYTGAAKKSNIHPKNQFNTPVPPPDKGKRKALRYTMQA